MHGNPARTLLAIVMNLIIAWAVALTVRLGVEFFGQLASLGWGKAIVAFTRPLVIPFGIHAVKTPYGGVFNLNAVVLIGLLLLVEWALSGVRDRA